MISIVVNRGIEFLYCTMVFIFYKFYQKFNILAPQVSFKDVVLFRKAIARGMIRR